MARYEEHNHLDYRMGGDTIDDFAQKYMSEITRIFQFLNDLREHKQTGTEFVAPASGQFKVEDGKLYIFDASLGENGRYVWLGNISDHLGLTAETIGALPNNNGAFGAFSAGESDDMPVSANEGDTYWTIDQPKIYMWKDGAWRLMFSLNVEDLTGYNTLVKQSDVSAVGGTPNKVAMTNANGVLPFDISGNAGKIAGINTEVDNLQDGQVLTFRTASNSWRNENKGVVGAGRSLTLYDGARVVADYSGDAHIEVNLAQHLRHPSTEYVAGDKRRLAEAPLNLFLECITAGTSDSTELTNIPDGVGVGDTFTDGTVRWEVKASVDIVQYTQGLAGKVDKVTFNDLFRDTAAAHNCIYRGKDLTEYWESGEMSAAIADGSFRDIYPGDYIIKTVTIDGTTYKNQKFIVMDLDYFQPWSFNNTDTHHIVMMPEDALGTQYMNSTSITTGGYVNSYMHKTHIPKVNTGIVAAFGSAHVLSHQEYLTNTVDTSKPSGAGGGYTGCATNWAVVSGLKCCLCSENMVYGSRVWGSAMDTGCASKQLAAFRHNQQLRKTTSFWLRAVSDSSTFADASSGGIAYRGSASSAVGVRPYFLLA
jgi:hypothetical protein